MAFAAKAKEPLNGTAAQILPLEMVKKSYPDMAAAERVETNMLDCTNVVLLLLVFFDPQMVKLSWATIHVQPRMLVTDCTCTHGYTMCVYIHLYRHVLHLYSHTCIHN